MALCAAVVMGGSLLRYALSANECESAAGALRNSVSVSCVLRFPLTEQQTAPSATSLALSMHATKGSAKIEKLVCHGDAGFAGAAYNGEF